MKIVLLGDARGLLSSRKIEQAGWENVVFVTARDRPEPIQLWLNRNLAPVPTRSIWVMAAGYSDANLHYLKAHAIEYFVVDRLKTCFDLAREGISPIVFAQPWNRQPHPFLEVIGWPDLATLLFEDGGGIFRGKGPGVADPFPLPPHNSLPRPNLS